MRIRFVYLRPIPVLQFRAVGPYEYSVRRAWQALFAWLDARDLRKHTQRAFGTVHDRATATAPEALRYDACLELVPGLCAEPELGIIRGVTPWGAYARGDLAGCHSQISGAFRFMCSRWAEAENLRVDTTRPLMEIYLNDPATTPRDALLTQLCVPIRTEPDPRKLLHVRDEELELDA